MFVCCFLCGVVSLCKLFVLFFVFVFFFLSCLSVKRVCVLYYRIDLKSSLLYLFLSLFNLRKIKHSNLKKLHQLKKKLRSRQ